MGGAKEPRGGHGLKAPWWPLFVFPCAAWAAVAYGEAQAGVVLPRSLAVAGPFLLVPVLYLLWRREPLALGRLDRGLALSAACYAPFAAWAVAAAWGNEAYFKALAQGVAGAGAAALWALDTFFHVGAQDFFTKRVVQLEAQARYGPSRAFWLQLAAWCVGHVVEWFWLRFLLGDVGAAVFLGTAGAVTGLAYMRWKNALGLMVGHFLVNVAAVGAGVALYG